MIKNKFPSELIKFTHYFNRKKYFEAHEILEPLWIQSKGKNKIFYQGLIQISVAQHHLQNNNKIGAKNLFLKARKKLKLFPKIHLNIQHQKILNNLEEKIKINP